MKFIVHSFFVIFFLLIFHLLFTNSAEAIRYFGNDQNGNPGAYFDYDSGTGASSCSDFSQITTSNLDPCLNELEPYRNTCCTSNSGCTAADNSSLSLWQYNYASGCTASRQPDLSCGFSYKYVTQTCRSTDTCRAEPYLYPGLCTQNGCAISDTRFKVCCNANGTVDGNCSGGDYTGTCTSDYHVVCGVTSCAGVAGNCTTLPCGTAACAAFAQATPPPPPTPTPPPATECTNAPTATPSSPTTFSATCDPVGGSSCPVSCTKTCTDSAGRTCTVPGTQFWNCLGGTQWFTNGVCSATCPASCAGPAPTPPPPPPPNPGFCTYNDYRCPSSCQGGGTYFPAGQCIEGGFEEELRRFVCERRSGIEGCYDQSFNYCGPVTITSRFCSGSQSQACAFPWYQPNPAPFCGNQQWGCYCSSFIPGFGYAPILQQCSGGTGFGSSLDYCHTSPGDEDTCGPWTGPACGTQTRTCKTTSCQNCNNTRQVCSLTISGNVFVDTNANGVKDGGEPNFSPGQIGNGFSSTSTDQSGNYSFVNLQAGSYIITLTVPASYVATTTNPVIVSLTTTNQVVNFGIIQNNWTITGNVFVDTNTNTLKDAGEQNYTGSINISISPASGVTTYSSPGQYFINNVGRGTYTVSYTNPPAGYSITYPGNGPPPSFTVGLGPCSPGGSNSASCSGQRLDNLNFGINFLRPWIQCKGADCRVDSGFTSEVPATAIGGAYANLNGSGGTPGLIFTGNATPNFGQGQASTTNWVVGGPTFGETYSPTKVGGIVKTSYNFVSAKAAAGNITPIDLAAFCSGGLSNCTLTFGASSHGVYRANGNLTLNTFTFPAGQNYVILVNGNLNIRGRITVPNGSTALLSSSGNITVDRTIGEAASSTSPTIEGIYSADRSFIVQGVGGCSNGADLRFNVAGSIIANAALSGGSFQNQRDLCANDSFYPTVYFSERLDFVLNTPDFMKQPNFTYQEIAP